MNNNSFEQNQLNSGDQNSKPQVSRLSTINEEDSDKDFRQVIKLIDQSDLPHMMQAAYDHLVCGLTTIFLILVLAILARFDFTDKPLFMASSD